MANVLLPLQVGNLAPNYCFVTWQKYAVDIAAVLFAKLSGQSFYSVGATKPDVQFNAYPWFNTTDGKWYTFSGSWLTPHPWQQSTSAGLRLEWEGSEPDLALFDGGSVGVVGPSSGPMWQIDHNYDGRSSMGPGVIPGSDPAKTLALSEDYGSGIVADADLSVLLNHVHVFGRMQANLTNDDFNFVTGIVESPGLTGPQVLGASATSNANPAVALSTFAGPYLNTGAMQNIDNTPTEINIPIAPPVRGSYKIKRTTRTHYSIP